MAANDTTTSIAMRSTADIPGPYLLAKAAGIFLDATGTEICPLPPLPPFATTDHLRPILEALQEPLTGIVVRRPTRRPGGGQEVRLWCHGAAQRGLGVATV